MTVTRINDVVDKMLFDLTSENVCMFIVLLIFIYITTLSINDIIIYGEGVAISFTVRTLEAIEIVLASFVLAVALLA